MKTLKYFISVFAMLIMIIGCQPTSEDLPNLLPEIIVEDTYTIDVGDESFDILNLITIEDEEDGTIPLTTSMIHFNDFDVHVPGSYDITITVADSQGALSEKTITILVTDRTKPTIELTGEAEFIMVVGEDYVENGANVSDNFDNEITWIKVGTVDTEKIGLYVLEYYAIDSSGNRSDSVYRDVYVIAREPSVDINQMTPTQDSLTFDIDITDPDNTGEITAIELYQDTVFVASLSDLSLRQFTGLMSGKTYKIHVTYAYDLSDTQGPKTLMVESDDITTLTKTVPSIEIQNIVADEDKVTFEILMNDADDIAHIRSVKLYQEEVFIEELSDLSTLMFDELIEGSAYTIVVAYDYDLNDGAGLIDQTIQQSFTTLVKVYVEPTVTLELDLSDPFAVTAIVDVDDPSEIAYDFDVMLTDEEGQVITWKPGLSDLTFGNLDLGKTYIVWVTYFYDLNDGLGGQYKYAYQQFSTMPAYQEPSFQFIITTIGHEFIEFDIQENDPDHVGEIITFEVRNLKTYALIYDSYDEDLTILEDLLSNTPYLIYVEYTYDLRDGEGIQSVVYEEATYTDQYAISRIDLNDLVIYPEHTTFDMDVNDFDQKIIDFNVQLFTGETLLESYENTIIGGFDELNPATTYTVVVTYTYDHNDGLGVIEVTQPYALTTTQWVSLNPSMDETIFLGEQQSITYDITGYTELDIDVVIFNGQTIDSMQFTDNLLTFEYVFYHNPGRTHVYDAGFIIYDWANHATKVFIDPTPYEFTILDDVDVVSITIDEASYNADPTMFGLNLVVDSNTPYDIEIIYYDSGGSHLIEAVMPHDGNYMFLFTTAYCSTYCGIDIVGFDVIYEDTVLYIPASGFTTFYFYYISDFGSISYPEDYHYIYTVDDLFNMKLDGVNMLMNDLDLTGYSWMPIGSYDEPFSGYFFGNGYDISNVNIVDGSTYYGFFGFAVNAFITSVSFTDVSIQVSTSEIDIYLGSVVGQMVNGTIQYVDVSTDIYLENGNNNSQTIVGGLVGKSSGYMHYSKSSGSIHIEDHSNSAQPSYIGGLIGDQQGSIMASSSSINITVDYLGREVYRAFYLGGISGDLDGKILSVEYTGTFTLSGLDMTAFVGGVVGRSEGQIDNARVHMSVSDLAIRSYHIGGVVARSMRETSSIKHAVVDMHIGIADHEEGYIGGVIASHWNETAIIYNAFVTLDLVSFEEDLRYVYRGMLGESPDLVKSFNLYGIYQFTVLWTGGESDVTKTGDLMPEDIDADFYSNTLQLSDRYWMYNPIELVYMAS